MAKEVFSDDDFYFFSENYEEVPPFEVYYDPIYRWEFDTDGKEITVRLLKKELNGEYSERRFKGNKFDLIMQKLDCFIGWRGSDFMEQYAEAPAIMKEFKPTENDDSYLD